MLLFFQMHLDPGYRVQHDTLVGFSQIPTSHFSTGKLKLETCPATQRRRFLGLAAVGWL